MKSFSTSIREEILKIDEKQKLCCSFSLLYGMLCYTCSEKEGYYTFSTNAENLNILKKICEIICQKKKIDYSINSKKILVNKEVLKYFTFAEIAKNVFKCSNCTAHFLRGVVLTCASVSNPEKAYRIDLTFNHISQAKEIQNLFLSLDLKFKLSTRNGKYILYSKDSDTISDLLALIGANGASFKVINTKILKELRNDANRVSNCDSANIDKTIKANEKYIVAIKELIKSGKISMLPDHLKEMALKRIEFDNLSFTELGKKFSPPISKSGVFHRLEKILEFYENNCKNTGGPDD